MRTYQTHWSEVKTHQKQGQQQLQRQSPDNKTNPTWLAEKTTSLFWLVRAVARVFNPFQSTTDKKKYTNEHVAFQVSIGRGLLLLLCHLNRFNPCLTTERKTQCTYMPPSQTPITLWQSIYSSGCLCWFSLDKSQTITFFLFYCRESKLPEVRSFPFWVLSQTSPFVGWSRSV